MNLLLQKSSRSTRGAAPFVIIAGCLLLMLTGGCRVEAPPESTTPSSSTSDTPSSADSSSTDSASAKTAVVTLEIFKPDGKDNAAKIDSDIADYTQTFDISEGTTLEEVMRKLQQPKVIITGSGETAFVKSIDGVAPNSSRGWTFTIDDKFSNVGIGSVKLSPPQTVRWRFTTLEEATK